MSQFKDAKVILADVVTQEKKLDTVCDWTDPQDVAEYRREQRLEERLKALTRLVPDRKCPGCGEIKPASRQWVIRRGRARCRSCDQTEVPEGSVLCEVEIFPVFEPRYSVDGAALMRAREEKGISGAAFAKLVGWSRQHQARLETGRTISVSADTAETILQVLQEAGIRTNDVL